MYLLLEIEAFEDRIRIFVEVDCGLGIGDESVDESSDALVDLFVVRADPLGLMTREIPNDAEGQVML